MRRASSTPAESMFLWKQHTLPHFAHAVKSSVIAGQRALGTHWRPTALATSKTLPHPSHKPNLFALSLRKIKPNRRSPSRSTWLDRGVQSGETLSNATLYATLTQLKRFFQWLSQEPGYRSRIHHSVAEYFNLSEKDTRIATAEREPRVPAPAQIKRRPPDHAHRNGDRSNSAIAP